MTLQIVHQNYLATLHILNRKHQTLSKRQTIPDVTTTPQLVDTPHITPKNIPDDPPTPQLPDTPNIAPEIHQQDEPEPQIQPEVQHEQLYDLLQQPPNTSNYVKKSFNWWRSPLNDESEELKFQVNPNQLYYKISQIEKDRFYEPKEEGTYGLPLLSGNQRRLRVNLQKQAEQIRLSLNLNRDAIT